MTTGARKTEKCTECGYGLSFYWDYKTDEQKICEEVNSPALTNCPKCGNPLDSIDSYYNESWHPCD